VRRELLRIEKQMSVPKKSSDKGGIARCTLKVV
jgi:hypothetical protein